MRSASIDWTLGCASTLAISRSPPALAEPPLPLTCHGKGKLRRQQPVVGFRTGAGAPVSRGDRRKQIPSTRHRAEPSGCQPRRAGCVGAQSRLSDPNGRGPGQQAYLPCATRSGDHTQSAGDGQGCPQGDQVVITAKTGSISVRMPGEAMADGAPGKQIPVKNQRSGRTIKARVTGPGRGGRDVTGIQQFSDVYPGKNAKVSITVAEHMASVLIPSRFASWSSTSIGPTAH